MSWCVIGVGVGWSLQPYEVKVTTLVRQFISIHDLYLLPDFLFLQFVVELYQIAAHFTTSCLKVTQHASSHHDPNSFRHPHLLPHSTVSLQPALDSVCVLDRWQRNLRCGFCWAKRDICARRQCFRLAHHYRYPPFIRGIGKFQLRGYDDPAAFRLRPDHEEGGTSRQFDLGPDFGLCCFGQKSPETNYDYDGFSRQLARPASSKLGHSRIAR